MTICSPGEHPHSDRPNFTLEDYIQMCRDGEATFTLSAAAKLMGVSRMTLHRWIIMDSVSDEEFEDVIKHVLDRGLRSTTAVTDEIKRRQGKARTYTEKCPHCGGALRQRRR